MGFPLESKISRAVTSWTEACNAEEDKVVALGAKAWPEKNQDSTSQGRSRRQNNGQIFLDSIISSKLVLNPDSTVHKIKVDVPEATRSPTTADLKSILVVSCYF